MTYDPDYYQKHKKEFAKSTRQWRKDHPKKLKQYAKTSNTKRAEAIEKWKKDHPERMKEIAHRAYLKQKKKKEQMKLNDKKILRKSP
jgi:hypothetical protein